MVLVVWVYRCRLCEAWVVDNMVGWDSCKMGLAAVVGCSIGLGHCIAGAVVDRMVEVAGSCADFGRKGSGFGWIEGSITVGGFVGLYWR